MKNNLMWHGPMNRMGVFVPAGAVWIGILTLSMLTGCSKAPLTPIDISNATFVGSTSCKECHAQQMADHANSHHGLAMQVANESTVLGDFQNATLLHHGIESRMFRRDDKFFVNTEGPDGLLHDYQVTYVFGVTPLQQYMVEFPAISVSHESAVASSTSSPTQPLLATGEHGLPRIQVLPICWDTHRKRWFYLDPPDVQEKLNPHDDLHWTGIGQRWNTMCAECHSTNYQKQFKPGQFLALASHSPDTANQADSAIGEYQSTFSEIQVACEACHGPASVHVELARRNRPGWSRQSGFGLADLKQSAEQQIQSCAPCHARRGVIFPDFKAGNNYYDHYQENLLQWPVYYPDGQVLDEDYIHGSFIQSKMYHKGIRCTDCHDPHTARLKHSGNQVCTSCHQHPSAKYDSPSHHFHKPGSEGASCVNCHMPTTTYMQVDARHDHSLRVPRPDMSLLMNTPNACTGCHLKLENIDPTKHENLKLYQDWMQAARDGDSEIQAEIDRANRWCNEACDRWYGQQRRRDEHWGLAIHAGQQRSPDAQERLLKLINSRGDIAPAIARATALQILLELSPAKAGEEALAHLSDPHPLVRSSAATAVAAHATTHRAVSALESALQDPIRSVRLSAVHQLLNLPAQYRSQAAQPALSRAIDEMKQGLSYSNDRAGSHLTLGTMAEQMGLDREAIKNYETAIVVEPAIAGPRTNLAAVLSRNLASATSMPQSLRDKMLAMVDQLRAEELRLLQRDVQLLTDPPAALMFQYGLALYLSGRSREAVEYVTRAAEKNIGDPLYALSAAELYEKLDDTNQFAYWAGQAVKRDPESPEAKAILERALKSANKQP